MIVRLKRGNVEKEYNDAERFLATSLELRHVDVNDLRKAFERVGDYAKPVPKIGRPKTSESVKRQRKYNEEKSKGMIHMFTFDQMFK